MNVRLAAALVLCAALPLAAQLKVPPTRTVEVADTYFGKTYKDPYRWLEDLKSPEVEAWFKAQAQVTDGALGKLPGVEALAQEWLALGNSARPLRGSVFGRGRVKQPKILWRLCARPFVTCSSVWAFSAMGPGQRWLIPS